MREADVRAAIASRVQTEHADEPDTRLIHEFDLCQAEARIDLAVVNGRLIGWEIKTPADTLARLPRQEPVYSRIFDRVWLAAATRHLDAAYTQIPPWWGVVEVLPDDGTCRLRVVRRSKLNPDVDLHSVVRLLWRAEALDELGRLELARGLERAPRRVLWQALADAAPRHISTPALKSRVRERLKTRAGWRSDVPRT